MSRIYQKHKDEQMEQRPYPICRVCGRAATHYTEKDIGFTVQNNYYCKNCLYEEYLAFEEDVFPLKFGEYLAIENYKEL